MASLIDTLIDVLDKENTQYERLLDLSNTKTAAIVNGDVDKLQEILGQEQQSIDIINRLDAKREENVKDICNVLNLRTCIRHIFRLFHSKMLQHKLRLFIDMPGTLCLKHHIRFRFIL